MTPPANPWVRPRTIGPFECFGRRWLIKIHERELAAFVGNLYRSMAAERPGAATELTLVPPHDERPGLVSRDGELVRASRDPDRLLRTLVWTVNRLVIDPTSRQRLVLHAAAAELDGRGVVLAAPMEAGKTTLVTALLDRGFAYLTDEAVAVDPDGGLEGFAKPLSIDEGSWEVLAHHAPSAPDSVQPYLSAQWQVAPHDVGPVVRRSRLALLVLPRYEPGAELHFEWVKPSELLIEAMPTIFAPESERVPTRRVRQLAALAVGRPVARLVYSDLAPACERITEALDPAASPSRTADAANLRGAASAPNVVH